MKRVIKVPIWRRRRRRMRRRRRRRRSRRRRKRRKKNIIWNLNDRSKKIIHKRVSDL